MEVLLKKKTFFLEETKLSIKVIVCLTSRLGFNCISAVPVSLITFRVERGQIFCEVDEKGKFRDKKLLWVTWSLTGSTCMGLELPSIASVNIVDQFEEDLTH